eukprot:scaffold42538_cov14-Tisochrysis_lutea.AAC.1
MQVNFVEVCEQEGAVCPCGGAGSSHKSMVGRAMQVSSRAGKHHLQQCYSQQGTASSAHATATVKVLVPLSQWPSWKPNKGEKRPKAGFRCGSWAALHLLSFGFQFLLDPELCGAGKVSKTLCSHAFMHGGWSMLNVAFEMQQGAWGLWWQREGKERNGSEDRKGGEQKEK